MTSSNEIDSHFVKCLGFLHASSKLRRGDPVPLQYVLEEAIKIKYGIVKDYTDLVQACLKPRENVPLVNTPFEESKGSNSDNELELDLLKEDLMCVICKLLKALSLADKTDYPHLCLLHPYYDLRDPKVQRRFLEENCAANPDMCKYLEIKNIN
nr:uncharacterized protein LOC111509853 isoform X1 [Leptinotarsa decemlineata]